MSSSTDHIRLDSSWKTRLEEEFTKPYMLDLRNFLAKEIAQAKPIFPSGKEYFAAMDFTPYENVKVVILGQDPYHGDGQAHGLCFSVKPGVPLPPSLKNIYKEIKDDLGIDQPNHGCLASWAKQGVLLLNSVLTVERSKPGSHQNRGWETFTDQIVRSLNDRSDPIVFVLWGAYAQRKGEFIDQSKHLVLKAAHPSPFSSHKGFFGCKHFSAINRFLKQTGKTEINWQLPDVEHAMA